MTEAKHLVLPTLMHRLHDSSQMSACVLGGEIHGTHANETNYCVIGQLTVTQDMISFRFVF